MSFDDMIEAVRLADGNDPELAAATRVRLRRSLETRERGRHQLAGLITAIAVLSAGTVSWALATGRIASLWAPAPVPPEAAEVAPPPAPPRRPASHAIAAVPRPVPEQEPPPSAPPPAPVVPPQAPRAPREPVHVPARAADSTRGPVEVLYRRAHELHFHGRDPAAGLAAWDAYLAAEPDGRFSAEARYNRAILLIRLARYAEARTALLPFARGEVELVGYRQAEATQLIARLARYQ
jgi:hypothetical protein